MHRNRCPAIHRSFHHSAPEDSARERFAASLAAPARLLRTALAWGLLTSAGLWAVATTAMANESAVKRYHVYIGTYTGGESKGIYVLDMDLETGRLGKLRLAAESVNPSFLALHPNGRSLYAVNEIGNYQGEKAGAVTAFAIDRRSGGLKEINQQSSRGGAPCHLVVDRPGKNVLVANYTGGSVACLPIRAGGGLAPASAFVQHSGSSVNPARQEGPHGHSINLDRENRFAFAADLGLDKVLIYRFDSAKGSLQANDPAFARVSPGSGPRHFAFHPNGKYAYVINEMLLTVTAFAYDAKRGALRPIQTITTLPDGKPQRGQSTAEVRVSPDGRHLYGSNRGHNTLAIFSIDPNSGRLSVVGHQSTGGKTPRNFGIDPSGAFIIAANQSSNSLVVFRRDAKTGRLTPTGQTVPAPAPVCVKFLPQQ